MKWEILKGSEKDFEGGPEWATLLTKTGGKRFFVEKHAASARVIDIDNREEFKIDANPVPHQFDDIEIIAERSPITEPDVNRQMNAEWSGDGLPPVGALCRYRAFSDMPWVECKVLAWHDDEVWLKRTEDGKTFTMGNPELFPILSPEDVAMKKSRSEECDKIFGILSGVERAGNRSDMAEALYDAGYRKVE